MESSILILFCAFMMLFKASRGAHCIACRVLCVMISGEVVCLSGIEHGGFQLRLVVFSFPFFLIRWFSFNTSCVLGYRLWFLMSFNYLLKKPLSVVKFTRCIIIH